MDITGRGAPEGGVGGCVGGLFAVGAERIGVVGLPGNFVDGVRAEGVGGGGRARREGLGREFGGGVVAYLKTGFVLRRRQYLPLEWSLGDAHCRV